ncbi:MAG: hypothetical protein ACR2I5_01575 [Candidatus Limnocylindria bacterium]
MNSSRASLGAFVILAVIATIVRLMSLEIPGHDGDVLVMVRWAERMAEVGPWRFYDGSGSIYPALLYPLWGLGAALDGDALDLAIKGFSIPFDLATGALIFAVLRHRGASWPSVAASGLYLLNPAAILAGPVWGQLDSAGTLPFLGALIALAAGRHGLAGALAVIATLVKPQFGLVLLPVIGVAALHWRAQRNIAVMWRAAGGMAIAAALVAIPLALHPLRYFDQLGGTAVRQPVTSLYAFNPWGLFVGFDVPDDPYVVLAASLLLLSIAGVLTTLRRGSDFAMLLAIGAALALAFYFVPTRVHERYLYPAIALLAPFAVIGPVHVASYVALSVGFAASLVYALHVTTPFTVPEPAASWLTSSAGIWAIGLVLMSSAVAWTWLLLVRRPRLPGRAPDRGP